MMRFGHCGAQGHLNIIGAVDCPLYTCGEVGSLKQKLSECSRISNGFYFSMLDCLCTGSSALSLECMLIKENKL